MVYSEPARTATRRMRIRPVRVACLLVAVAAIAVALDHGWPSSSSSTAPSSLTAPSPATAAPPIGTPRSVPDRTLGVGNLDPALAGALRQAATVAGNAGIRLTVNSGWRSPEYQEQLLREAILKYGSEAEAARWVATPDRSPHVSGDAVDIGPSEARTWLSLHGARYGLCQIYDNEPWHYELRSEAIDHGCPARYADPTHDPRMHRDE